MSHLIYTHLLLRAAGAPDRLPEGVLRILDDPVHAPWFSSASLWEIAIKRSLGRDDFRIDPRRLRRGLLDGGWRELGITSEHALATQDLPPVHKDPFDRILVAQAHLEDLPLLTADRNLAAYGADVRLV